MQAAIINFFILFFLSVYDCLSAIVLKEPCQKASGAGRYIFFNSLSRNNPLIGGYNDAGRGSHAFHSTKARECASLKQFTACSEYDRKDGQEKCINQLFFHQRLNQCTAAEILQQNILLFFPVMENNHTGLQLLRAN
jgi:hypothetical protein